MWDPSTNRVHTTRDIIWLKRMFYPKQIRPEISTAGDEAGEGLEVRIESSGEGDATAVDNSTEPAAYAATANEIDDSGIENENENENELEPKTNLKHLMKKVKT